MDKVCACKSLMQVSSSKYLSLQAAVCAWAVAWAVARSVESSMHVVCFMLGEAIDWRVLAVCCR